MKILDLFCCAGGAAMGYHRAFPDAEIIGIDINPQPNYPFQFVQGDAIAYCLKHGSQFDLIHASPPCQFFSSITPARSRSDHPNLIPATRTAIQKANPTAYVIENVTRSRQWLVNPIMLCGSQFGLKVYRHRLFECQPFLFSPPHSPHQDQMPSANRKGGLEANLSPKGFISVVGGGSRDRAVGRKDVFEYRKFAMGIDWMNRYELCQSIPPAYTEFIGKQLKGVFHENCN